MTPVGTPLKGVNRTSYWTARVAEGASQAKDLGSSLADILDVLEDKGDFFADLNASGGSAEFFVGWFFDEGNSGDVLKHDLLGRLARLGVDLSFDVYPPETPFVGDSITHAWLSARGGLHDARVLGVSTHGQVILMSINDEWANNDDNRAARPGTLSLHHPHVVRGGLADLVNAWISEVRLDAADQLIFDFCDHDQLVIKAKAVWWLAD